MLFKNLAALTVSDSDRKTFLFLRTMSLILKYLLIKKKRENSDITDRRKEKRSIIRSSREIKVHIGLLDMQMYLF